MNTRSEAYEQIKDFLLSDEKGLLLTGTHQYEKHPLIMKAIAQTINKPATILFRANSMQNLGTFFEARSTNFKTGTGYKLGNHQLYVDTINKSSWKNTNHRYNYAILYPLDSSIRNLKNLREILYDLYETRDIDKIFFVSWTDQIEYDYEYLKNEDYIQRHVIFDALEERPDYHQRMLEV